MSKRTALWILIAIVIVGVGLRSYQLTARSLWFDEAFSWRLVQFPIPELLQRAAADVHPPLYYLLLKGWTYVFGTSLLALRSFSVTLSAATLSAAYLFTSTAVRSRSAGLLASLLLALSGWQIQYAWEARMYTLGTALVLLSSWFLLRALRVADQPRSGTDVIANTALYIITATAFAYTHYYAFFSLAAQALFVLGYIVVSTRGRIGEIVQSRLVWAAVAALVCIPALYSPWLPIFFAQNSQVQDAYWIPSIGGWSIPDTFYRLFAPTSGIPRHTGLGWIAVALVPITATIIGWILLVTSRSTRATKDADWLIVLMGSIPFVLSIGLSFVSQSLYQDRFFIFAHVFIIIALAVLLMRIPWPLPRRIAATIAALLFAVASGAYWLELDILHKPGARAATDYIYTQHDDSEPIVVSSPFVYFAIRHYAVETHESDQPRLFSESGQLLHFAGGPILIPDDITGPTVFDTDTSALWVVDTTGFGGTPLPVPAPWEVSDTATFPEVFAHQGEIIVTRYTRNTIDN